MGTWYSILEKVAGISRRPLDPHESLRTNSVCRPGPFMTTSTVGGDHLCTRTKYLVTGFNNRLYIHKNTPKINKECEDTEPGTDRGI